MIIQLSDYGECQSATCPFVRECAQHESAGDYRTEDGFSPEISSVGDKHASCETSSQSVLDYEFATFPVNYDELDRGFKKL